MENMEDKILDEALPVAEVNKWKRRLQIAKRAAYFSIAIVITLQCILSALNDIRSIEIIGREYASIIFLIGCSGTVLLWGVLISIIQIPRLLFFYFLSSKLLKNTSLKHLSVSIKTSPVNKVLDWIIQGDFCLFIFLLIQLGFLVEKIDRYYF